MKPCPDREEALWLDVYGALAPEERRALERHLETCEPCRQERQRLLRFLQLFREAMPPPALSPEKARALHSSIMRTMEEERAKTWWRKRILGVPIKPIPALVAASLLVAALGWFGLTKFQVPSPVQPVSSIKTEEQMIVKNLEIIENLELLEEMDALRKLVQVLDQRDVML